jgi:hypothetical protein
VSAEQTEFICPTCRWKTVVNADAEAETLMCPRCEIEMKLHVATSQVAAAAANAPTSSGDTVGAPATKTRRASATKTTKTKTAAVKAPKAPKAPRVPRLSAKAAALAALPPIPDFGEFRCGCCGFIKQVPFGSEKPTAGWRCPTCYVRMDWIRA